jgi:hypothetical protein
MFDRYNTVDAEDAKKAIEQFREYLVASTDQSTDQKGFQKEKEASRNQLTS